MSFFTLLEFHFKNVQIDSYRGKHFFRSTIQGFVWSLYLYLPFLKPVLNKEQVVQEERDQENASG